MGRRFSSAGGHPGLGRGRHARPLYRRASGFRFRRIAPRTIRGPKGSTEVIPGGVKPAPIWVTVDADASLEQVSSFLNEAVPYGVILFSRHLREAAQVRELNACIHAAVRGWAPRIAVDQEGGRVNRLSALGMHFPSASEMAGDAARVESVAFDMGTRLNDLGFDVDFAPWRISGRPTRERGWKGAYTRRPRHRNRLLRGLSSGPR